MNLADVEFQYTRGKGPGGQHKNKVASCVVAIHRPTGLSARVDGRNQHANKRAAIKALETLLAEKEAAEKAAVRKARRDTAIRDTTTIRTYDFSRGVVKDHRTGKTASLKNVLEKGKFDLLNP